MRKHFLILMLLTLLPLAGFAVPVEYTEVTVTLGAFNKSYDGTAAQALPTVTVNGKKGDADAADLTSGTDFDLVWKNPAGVVITNASDVVGAGNYTVTVVAHTEGDTFAPAAGKSLTQTFTVNKAQLDVTAKNVTISYGQDVPAIAAFYEIDDTHGNTWKNNETAATAGVPVSLPSTVTADGVKTINYTLVANELPNYSINFVAASATFAVSAKSITVTPTFPAAQNGYTYGDALPEWGATYGQMAFSEEPSVLGTPSYYFYKYVNNQIPANPTKLTTITDAGTYQVNIEGLSNANYNITCGTVDFTYQKKELSADMITLKSGSAAFSATYDGTQHIPTVEVTDGTNAIVAHTATVAGDYAISWKKGDNAINPATATDFVAAGDDYKVIIAATEGGNYKDPQGGVVSKTFSIARKAVSLRTVGEDNLTYSKQQYTSQALAANAQDDGKYRLSTTANLIWDGVLAADLNDNNLLTNAGGATIALALYDGANALADNGVLHAKNYTVKATVTGVNAVNGAYPMGNYIVTVGNIGKVKIGKKTVTIHAKNQSVDYGTNNEFVSATAIGPNSANNATNAPYDVVATYLWIGTLEKNAQGVDHVVDGTGLAGDDTYSGIFGYANDRVKLQRESGNTVGVKWLRVILPSTTFDDYIFEAAADSAYTIKAIGGIQVWANLASSNYKAAKADLTAEIIGVEDADLSTTLQNAVNASLYVDVDGDDTDDDDVTTANAGQYTIKFDATKLAAAFAGLTNYDVTTIAKYSATYTVNRANLTVKAKPQVHQVGEAVTAAGSAQTIEYTLAEGQATPAANDLALIYNALALAYNLPTNTQEITYVDNDLKLGAGALAHGLAKADATHPQDYDTEDGVWYNGIVITDASVLAYNAANAVNAEENAIKNYTLVLATVNKAQLTVTTNETVTFAAAATDNSTKLAAREGEKLNVEISGRTLYGNEWNAFVLPFEITPLDFCKVIDSYAVFDVLEESGNAMNFKITLNTIPAYTPFLVKVNEDVAMTGKSFNKVTIAAIDEDALAPANDAYIFQGNLDMKTPANAWLFTANSGNGTIDLYHNVDEGTSTNRPCAAFGAYITAKSTTPANQAPVIYIEEADGSTTAITAINAEGVAVKAEGWYTINGMKLNAAPTEKGVYISNGKKVVVK